MRSSELIIQKWRRCFITTNDDGLNLAHHFKSIGERDVLFVQAKWEFWGQLSMCFQRGRNFLSIFHIIILRSKSRNDEKNVSSWVSRSSITIINFARLRCCYNIILLFKPPRKRVGELQWGCHTPPPPPPPPQSISDSISTFVFMFPFSLLMIMPLCFNNSTHIC